MPRGSRPGERRGGREKGTPNKATVEIKDVARKHGPAIIEAAAKLAGVVAGDDGLPSGKAASEQAQIAAMALVMGYGYGKPSQVVTGEGGQGPVLLGILDIIDGKTRGIPTGS